MATHWFDYLVCTPEELRELLHGTDWRLADVDDADAPYYLATLRLVGCPLSSRLPPAGFRHRPRASPAAAVTAAAGPAWPLTPTTRTGRSLTSR